jgi:hypothetical protein
LLTLFSTMEDNTLSSLQFQYFLTNCLADNFSAFPFRVWSQLHRGTMPP